MNRRSFILSSSGLNNIIPNIDNLENDFSFIFGDHEIRMSKINAEFISPLISNLHRTDPTINSYTYPSDESMNDIFTNEIFSKFNSLCRGESIELDIEESDKLKMISVLLWNKEMYDKLQDLYPKSTQILKFSEIIHKLIRFDYVGRYGDRSIIKTSDLIYHLSRYFYQIDPNELKVLPLDQSK